MYTPFLTVVFSIVVLIDNEPRFTAETIDDRIGSGQALAIGDVDGDGKPDILLVNDGQLVWYRNGDWMRFVMMENVGSDHPACVAVRDIDGDGQVEVAVGSDAVHYLIRPDDPTQLWTSVPVDPGASAQQLRWVRVAHQTYQLIVLPSPGLGSTERTDEEATNVWVYEPPNDPTHPWKRRTLQLPMPLAQQLEVYDYGDREVAYVCGDGGIMGFSFHQGRWTRNTADWLARGRQLSEARIGTVASRNAHVFAAIEPFQGHTATIYTPGLTDSLLVYDQIKRVVLEREMKGGNGLGMADLLGIQREQVVVGWQKPNAEGHFGIKLYVPFNPYWEAMSVYWVDRGGIACDGLQLADMDGDGKPDIIASSSATSNLVIYWNRTVWTGS